MCQENERCPLKSGKCPLRGKKAHKLAAVVAVVALLAAAVYFLPGGEEAE